MITSTISETKDHLSELLEKVQSGETLVIYDRKKPVARVERVSRQSSSPHMVPPRGNGSTTAALKLPIGGKKGKPDGILSAFLDERAGGL